MEETTVEPGDDLLCIACGYDLQRLSQDGVCPECGMAIARSLGGNCLARADAGWLKKLTFAQSLIAWSFKGLMFLAFMTVILSIIFPLVTIVPGSTIFSIVYELIAIICLSFVIAYSGMSVGVVFVVTPDPKSGSELPKGFEWILVVGFPLLNIVLIMLVGMILIGRPFMPSSFSVFSGIIVFGLLIVVLLQHLRKLIERIPNSILANRIKRCIRLTSGTILMIALFLGLFIITGLFGQSRVVINFLNALAVYGSFLFLVIFIFILLSASKIFIDIQRQFQMCRRLASILDEAHTQDMV